MEHWCGKGPPPRGRPGGVRQLDDQDAQGGAPLHGRLLTNKAVAEIYAQNLVRADDDAEDIITRDEKTVEPAVHVCE